MGYRQTERTRCMVPGCKNPLGMRGLCKGCWVQNRDTGAHDHITRIYDLERAFLCPPLDEATYYTRLQRLVSRIPVSARTRLEFVEHMAARYAGGSGE